MSPDRWSEVEKLYHAVAERPLAERAALLGECPDHEVRGEVQSLLDHEQEGEALLEHPVWRSNLSQGIGAPANPSLDFGTKVESYEILGFLGAGGMGEVYRACDTKLGRQVALKVLPKEFAHNVERVADFRREARVLASLNHRNIAAIYGFAELSGVCALAMELVEGPTLAERIATGVLTPEKAIRIAGRILERLSMRTRKELFIAT